MSRDYTQSFAYVAAETLTSVAKLLLKSRFTWRFPTANASRSLVVMGNGPSLRSLLTDDGIDVLGQHATLAVNFAAISPEFFEIKPDYYVLADPHFFESASTDMRVAQLWESLGRVDWPMTLFIPYGVNPQLPLHTVRFNMVGVEGPCWFEHFAYKYRLGMPRPRNVLIPSLMIGLWLGFKKIFVVGADHSWTQTLSVDSDNRVVSVQPHFYADVESEAQRVASVYANVKIHEILHSFSTAFRGYHRIRRFADSLGASIVNATEGSFIDAFIRGKLF